MLVGTLASSITIRSKARFEIGVVDPAIAGAFLVSEALLAISKSPDCFKRFIVGFRDGEKVAHGFFLPSRHSAKLVLELIIHDNQPYLRSALSRR